MSRLLIVVTTAMQLYTEMGKRAMEDHRTPSEKLLPDHLGGHLGRTNLDEPTLDYLIKRYSITSMLDVGCGPGGMVDLAYLRGLEAWGIDGDPHMARDHIYVHDYTTGPTPIPFERFDLIWSVEFVEHVEAQYVGNFLATFDAGRVLYLTAAPPGFPGHHHVNCQPPEYWIELLSGHDWALDEEATAWVRANAGHVFGRRQGLVFVKA